MKEESLLEEIGESLLEEAHGMVNVTVRADADCFLLCDGEYLDIQLEAGKMTKTQVPIGQHLLEFIYTEDANIKVEKVVDFPEAGKSYLVLVQELKAAADNVAAEAKAKEEAKRQAEEAKRQAEEAKRQAEEEAKRKAEEKEARRKAEEARRQALMQMDFVQKYLETTSIDDWGFRNNFIVDEIKKAVDEEIRPAADLGNASAQCVLGVYYSDYGNDDDEAVKWIRKSAEQGNAWAQYYLGALYNGGDDYAEAVKWLKKSAEQGNAMAQIGLGALYFEGKGVRQDYAEAVKWLKKSAEQGNDDAQYYLGYLYRYGKGVPQNRTEAKKWLKKSAEQGNDDALLSLQEF